MPDSDFWRFACAEILVFLKFCFINSTEMLPWLRFVCFLRNVLHPFLIRDSYLRTVLLSLAAGPALSE